MFQGNGRAAILPCVFVNSLYTHHWKDSNKGKHVMVDLHVLGTLLRSLYVKETVRTGTRFLFKVTNDVIIFLLKIPRNY